MKHGHCRHQFKFCAQCDMVWCGSCSKEWGGHAHYQPYVNPNPWWTSGTRNLTGTTTVFSGTGNHASHGGMHSSMTAIEHADS